MKETALASDEDNDGVPNALDNCSGSAVKPPVFPAFPYKYAIIREPLLPESKSWPVDEHGCEADSDGDG